MANNSQFNLAGYFNLVGYFQGILFFCSLLLALLKKIPEKNKISKTLFQGNVFFYSNVIILTLLFLDLCITAEDFLATENDS